MFSVVIGIFALDVAVICVVVVVLVAVVAFAVDDVVVVVVVVVSMYGKFAYIRIERQGEFGIGFQCNLDPKPDSPCGPLLTCLIPHM